MAIKWYKFYGGFNNSGPYNNVVLIGDPEKTTQFGIPLQKAHDAGRGKGIGFDSNGFDVKFVLDLVGTSVKDDGTYVDNSGSYVVNSGIYDWIFKVEVSSNNEKTYSKIFEDTIFSHPWQYTKIYSVKGQPDRYGQINQHDWTVMADASQWSKNFKLPENTTHVRVSIRGANATFPYDIVFTIDKIVSQFRPWAIRKSDTWKSLDNATGLFKRRSGGTWIDIPKMDYNQVGQTNKGTSRIRKSGQFVGQKRIGN